MEYVYKTLEKEISALIEETLLCDTVERKSELTGNKGLLEHAIKLLKKCDEHGVYAGSIFTKLPRKRCDSPSSEYRVIEDGETDDPQYWREVTIEGKQFNCVRLGEGDVVIEC
ncbi:hypothetical protein HCH_03994 [Hahella chejuensis KCTC 2396]|uniref:Uncharacterized protein n=1 Tax=Hahella chejuensis (strain KCTC 2396) TaxID=349521 RepID=Q2SF63_HAHCH|nr:hypothetical protein [Hahella chejuensis]ABC30711.1 hypothetical protein HCH_03994 [Hahella chejuensis KCTC 2396]